MDKNDLYNKVNPKEMFANDKAGANLQYSPPFFNPNLNYNGGGDTESLYNGLRYNSLYVTPDRVDSYIPSEFDPSLNKPVFNALPVSNQLGYGGYGGYRTSIAPKFTGGIKVPNYSSNPNYRVGAIDGVNADTNISNRIIQAFKGIPQTHYIVAPHVASLVRSIWRKG